MENNGKLQGEMINKIFKKSESIADLHAVLTSSTGDFFRLKLLQSLRKELTVEQLEDLRKEAKLHEHVRHMDKLVAFGMAIYKQNVYKRTAKGESALDAIKEFKRKVGKKQAEKIFKSSLGPNSIQLFLAVYGSKKHLSTHSFFGLFKKSKKLEIKYSPSEIGRIARLLSRSVDGVTAIDKLDIAGILTYEDDGYIHFASIRASSFYQYLKKLYVLSK